jgi:HlyD family secretion protein
MELPRVTKQTKQKVGIALGIAVVAVAVVVVNLYYQRSRGPEVRVETIERRDLTAVVSASGRIEPERLVNISSDTMGRVTELAVEEGDVVEQGQFLLLIDPESAESAVQMGEASLAAAREARNTARVAIETARANLELAMQNEQRVRSLYEDDLVSREALDRAESEVKVRKSELEAREIDVRAQEQRLEQQVANLRSARHVLSKVTIDSPMTGMITRLSIEEGETVVVGTMNNPGTVLMTVADLSVILAVLEVDETDIVDVRLGQPASVVIDAIPDEEFSGRVTKIGSSAIQPGANPLSSASDRQGTNFEVEVTLDSEVPGVRPDFSCTAEITTATREGAIAVPIQALTVREVRIDAEGHIVREDEKARRARRKRRATVGADIELEELEGVFLFREGNAVFTPVEIGIAGERYFEVMSGLEEGDQVITGPYGSVREIEDGDPVRIDDGNDDNRDNARDNDNGN